MLLLPFLFLISIHGESEARAAVGDSSAWEELRGVLPLEYAEYAEKQGLSQSRLFQNDLIRKLHNQVVSDSQAIEARQKILQEYVRCSCHKCPENETESTRAENPRQLRPLPNPVSVVSNIFASCETDLVMETVKVLRFNLLNLQLYNQQLTSLVTCNCPDSSKCRKILDPLIFSIVTGANDTELSKVFWQTSLDGFPVIVERGIMDRLQNAVAAIMTYFFQASRPQHDAQQSPLQSPPPTIFSPGNNEQSWQNSSPPDRKDCPLIHVSISNNREGTFSNNTTDDETKTSIASVQKTS